MAVDLSNKWVVGVIVLALWYLYHVKTRYTCRGWPIMVPSSEMTMIAPHGTLTPDQLAKLEAAARGEDVTDVLAYKDGWLEVSLDRSAVPLKFKRKRLKVVTPPKPKDAPAEEPEQTLRFVARKSVELGAPSATRTVAVDANPVKFRGINYAATLKIGAAAVFVPGRGTYDPGAPPDEEAVNDEEADLVVAHLCALVAVHVRGGSPNDLRAVTHAIVATVKEFGGLRLYLHGFLLHQFLAPAPAPCFGRYLLARLPKENAFKLARGHTRSYCSWVERGYFEQYDLSPPLPYFTCAYDLGLKSIHDTSKPIPKHDPTDPEVLAEQRKWWTAA